MFFFFQNLFLYNYETNIVDVWLKCNDSSELTISTAEYDTVDQMSLADGIVTHNSLRLYSV